VVRYLRDQAATLRFAEPDHFVFPWHGRNKNLDPSRAMTSWRTAWRNIRKAAGLPRVRFHDGRHTAITTLAEKGLPDWVIQAQVGHVAPEMMKTYSHIRRQALNQAAAALEPTQSAAPGPVTTPPEAASVAASQEKSVMSQPTSQNADRGGRVLKFAKKSGSSGWTRTSNPPVNSAMQVIGLAVLRAGSSDGILLVSGVRQQIVQTLCRISQSSASPILAPRSAGS
jgi:hypothetical protein